MVERTLGRGGMATVYLAHDGELGRPVALKVLSESLAADPAFRARFLREARLMANLVHPNVVQVYDVGEDERGLSIVMEYVEGETLAAELSRRGRLPPAEAATIGIQICSALQAAHSERLVHRDVKPQNILRRTDGVVKLADFGIARSLAATSHTELGTVLGTAAYLSPERARGEPVTDAADLYSLGVVLYELLTGELPFRAASLSELVLRRELGELGPPGTLAVMPPALNDAVLACLAPRPEDRPRSAASVAHLLAAALEEPIAVPFADAAGLAAAEILPVEAVTALVRSEYAKRARMLGAARRRPLALPVFLVLLALGALLATALAGRAGSRPTATAHAAREALVTPKGALTTQTTTAVRSPPATPSESIAHARAAIIQAETTGQLDPGAGGDLVNRLDEIARSLSAGASQDAAHKIGDLAHQFGDLVRAGRLGGGALSGIAAPIERLAALVPILPPKRRHPTRALRTPRAHMATTASTGATKDRSVPGSGPPPRPRYGRRGRAVKGPVVVGGGAGVVVGGVVPEGIPAGAQPLFTRPLQVRPSSIVTVFEPAFVT